MRGVQFSFTARKTLQPLPLEKPDRMIAYRRQVSTHATANDIFRVISSLGGKTGWLYTNILWRLRGYLDEFIGGPGLRRGRRDPYKLRIGDSLDFWRVEALIPDQLLRLRAEMKAPGKAWLQFEIIPQNESSVLIIQTAYYDPNGVMGLLYWYVLYPIHIIIFKGLITAIAHRAEALSSSEERTLN
jgi:hypothetical protein